MSLRVRHLPGYGVDPDLAAFDGDLPVTLATIEPYVDDLTHDADKARSFEALYRAHGPWALPPVLCVGDVNWQVGGGHRVEAAHRAGLPWIPAFVIDGPTPLHVTEADARRSAYVRPGDETCGTPHPHGGRPCQLPPTHTSHARPVPDGFDAWSNVDLAVLPLDAARALLAVYDTWMNKVDTYDPDGMPGIASLLGIEGSFAMNVATDAVEPHDAVLRAAIEDDEAEQDTGVDHG